MWGVGGGGWGDGREHGRVGSGGVVIGGPRPGPNVLRHDSLFTVTMKVMVNSKVMALVKPTVTCANCSM